MATTVTKVVDPNSGSGYDYASLSLWEAGQQGDLTGVRDEIAVAKCRCTGGTADTTAFTVDGWTTDSTRYIKIWTDPSESYRHNGTYQTGNKYRLELSGSAVTIITNLEDYVAIDGLQFKLTATGHWGGIINWTSATREYNLLRVSNCILWDTGNYVTTDLFVDILVFVQIWNCIFIKDSNYNHGSNCCIVYSGEDYYTTYQSFVYNCTFVIVGGAGSIGISASRGTLLCKNCLVKMTAGVCFSGATHLTNYNCASSDATADDFGGSGNRVSQTFSFVDADNDNFHLASNDAGALGYGLNLYNDAVFPFQTDIDGDDRGGAAAAWDIGADEYVAVGGSSIVPLLLYQYRARRQ